MKTYPLRFLIVGLVAGLFALALARAHAADAVAAEINPVLQRLMQDASGGSVEDQYQLGRVYALGSPAQGVNEQEPEKALVWFRRAAEAGHADAQFALGSAYEEGYGTGVDLNQAAAWYRRAADQGHLLAARRLGGLGAAAANVAPAPLAMSQQSQSAITPSEPQLQAVDNASGPRTQTDYTYERTFWPWWMGAAALGFVATAFWMVMGSTLGVSSSWDRIVYWRHEQELADAERRMHANRDQVSNALLAETIAQFGQEAVDQMIKAGKLPSPAAAASPVRNDRRIPWQAHITFLAMMAVGGFLASTLSGNFQIQAGLGPDFARFFGSGPQVWTVLVFGGFLVGFGTRMCGGCTSGHGLSGCSRLQPGSMASTASFFGTAIVVSLLLEVIK